jgi:hypothetical protein
MNVKSFKEELECSDVGVGIVGDDDGSQGTVEECADVAEVGALDGLNEGADGSEISAGRLDGTTCCQFLPTALDGCTDGC